MKLTICDDARELFTLTWASLLDVGLVPQDLGVGRLMHSQAESGEMTMRLSAPNKSTNATRQLLLTTTIGSITEMESFTSPSPTSLQNPT